MFKYETVGRKRCSENIESGWADVNWVKQLTRLYKLTLKDFDALWERQQGACVGCKEPFAYPLMTRGGRGEKPMIDHCHDTGKVRGLLCQSCNIVVGKACDRPYWLDERKDTIGIERSARLIRYLVATGDYTWRVATRLDCKTGRLVN